MRVISAPKDWSLYVLSEDCDGCPFQQYKEIESNYAILSTHHSWNLRIRSSNQSEFQSQLKDDEFMICQANNVHLGEFGLYDLDVGQNCSVTTRVEAVNEYWAILLCTAILLVLGLLYNLFQWAVKKRYTAQIERLWQSFRRILGYEVCALK